jgi:cytochrome c5
MPAKGGHSKLSDQNISDALYYMEVKIKALQ